MKSKLITIYKGTLWECELLKSILEGENIPVMIKNQVLNSYAFDPIRNEQVHVLINEVSLEDARPLVQDFLDNINKENE